MFGYWFIREEPADRDGAEPSLSWILGALLRAESYRTRSLTIGLTCFGENPSLPYDQYHFKTSDKPEKDKGGCIVLEMDAAISGQMKRK